MYVGRLLVVSPEITAYRVSSRSFPNRQIVERDNALTVIPTAEAPGTDNPYVSYNCLRVVESGGERKAAIGNGTQVDAIAEKLELGYPARDALASSLLAYDFEKDEYDTPRIAAVLGPNPTVGIVRRDALFVEPVEEPMLVATYEENRPKSIDLADDALDGAEAAARTAYDLTYEHAVCAAGIARDGEGFTQAIVNGADRSADR